jgi:cation:H+ antiporter
MAIAGFIICTLIIFFAGKKLSYYGDLIGDLTGVGKAWIGLIMMSAVTSLPELMVGISSSAILEEPDLATGDILGSCAFNLGILSLMDIFTPKDHPLFGHLSKSHILAAAFGIILIVFAGLGIFLNEDIVLTPSIGLTSLSFAIIYFISVTTIFKYQKSEFAEKEESTHHEINLTLKQVIWRYVFFALIIIVVALVLPHFAEQIAESTGLGKSFIGTLLLAISTSFPEIAVSIAAIKMGSTNMAIGNLMGSNIFNIFILFLDDLFYSKGHLLKDASDNHLVSVFSVIVISFIAVIGIIFPSKYKNWYLSWDTIMIFFVWSLNLILLYRLS